LTTRAAERDVIGNRHVCKQRIALEHETAVALAWRKPRDIAMGQAYAAGCRLDEAGHDAQGRGITAAGGAEQDKEFAIGNVERNVIGGLELAIALGDAG